MLKRRCTVKAKHTKKRCQNPSSSEALKAGQQLCWAHFKKYCPPSVEAQTLSPSLPDKREIELQQQVAELKHALSAVRTEAEWKSLNHSLKLAQKELGQLREAVQSLPDHRERENELQQEVTTLKNALSAVRTEDEWKSLDTNLKLAQTELSQLREESAREISALRESLKKGDGSVQIAQLVETQKGLEAALEELRNQRTAEADKIRQELLAQFALSLNASEKKYIGAEQKVQVLEQRLQEQTQVCERCIQEQKTAVARWKQASQEYQARIDETADLLKSCKESATSADEQNKSRTDSLRQEILNITDTLRQAREQFAEDVGNMEFARTVNAAAQQKQLREIAALKEELSEIKTKAEDYEGKLRSGARLNKELKAKVKELAASVQSLEQQNQEMVSEFVDAKRVVENSLLDTATLQRKYNALIDEYQEEQRKYKTLEAEHTELKKEYKTDREAWKESQHQRATWDAGIESVWLNREVEDARKKLAEAGIPFERYRPLVIRR